MNVSVYDIQCIDVPAELVKKHKIDMINNRSRVVALSEELH